MVFVPGDSAVALAPLAAAGGVAGGVTKTGQDVKRDVERKLPPMPWDLKPSGLGLPNPQDVFQEINSRVREIISFPLRLVEGGEIPSPVQGLQGLENKRPLEKVKRHVRSVPTPFEVFKDTIGKDIITPREFARDMERMMEDFHVLAEGANEAFQAQYPVTIQNTKQASADLNALRHVTVDLGQAGAKTMVSVGKSLSKALNTIAEEGVAGLVF